MQRALRSVTCGAASLRTAANQVACGSRWVIVLQAFSILFAFVAGCTGYVDGQTPGAPPNPGNAGTKNGGADTPSLAPAAIAAAGCRDQTLRGSARESVRRLTKGELVASLSELLGPELVQEAASSWAQLPDEPILRTGKDLQPLHSQPFFDGYQGVVHTLAAAIESSMEPRVIYPAPAAIDQLILAPFHKLADPYFEFGSFTWTSKGGSEQRVPAERDMKNVYNRLFAAAGAPKAPEPVGASRRKLATDLVIEQYRAAMNNRRIASGDRIRLDNYMTFLSEAGRRLGLPSAAPVNCGSVVAPAEPQSGEAYETSAIDMIVAALACGATRVASWSIMHHRSDANYSTVDDHAAGHESSHLPGSTQAQHNRFGAQRFAEILSKLDALEEPDGRTLLDNTLVYFPNEDSLGGHTHYEMPIVVAGGGGKLRMGYHMDFRPRPLAPVEFNVAAGTFQQQLGRPLNSLLVTFFQAMGLAPSDYQRFGKLGFGEYDRHHAAHTAHYAPFKTDVAKNEPLPFLYV